jgi:hypothetical protein
MDKMRCNYFFALLICSGIFLVGSAQGKSIQFEEHTFTNPSWLSPDVAFRDGSSFMASTSRQTTGGAPPDPSDGFVQVSHEDSDAELSTAVFFYSQPDWTYDPGTGAITSISGELKWKSISVPDWGAGFGFRQNDVVYAWTRFGDSTDWKSESLSIDVNNFNGFKLKEGFAIDDLALPEPDFSSNGDPIQFGTITFNQNLGNAEKIGGFDDVTWEVNAVPTPTGVFGGMALLARLGGVAGLRRKLRRG